MRSKVTIIEHTHNDGTPNFLYQFDENGIEIHHWSYESDSGNYQCHSDVITWEELFNEKKHWKP